MSTFFFFFFFAINSSVAICGACPVRDYGVRVCEKTAFVCVCVCVCVCV
jgi:hypothetical protein